MVDRADSREIAKRAEEHYEARWRAELERDPLHEFAAMEPESATYFLGKSFSDAIRSARLAHPDRVTFTLRIGHDCVIEMVGMQIERQLGNRQEKVDPTLRGGSGSCHGVPRLHWVNQVLPIAFYPPRP